MLVATVGFIGSGKDTVAEYLVRKYSFKQVAFADSLKEAVSAIFGWDYEMLLGKTKESRAWREEIDTWWSERLRIPNLTPRWVLQQWGTEVGRQSFHDEIWVASLERRLTNTPGNIVISDCRFPNEFKAVRNLGGSVAKTSRGPNPSWYNEALGYASAGIIPKEFPVHYSEWAWLAEKVDIAFDNNRSLAELYDQIDVAITNL